MWSCVRNWNLEWKVDICREEEEREEEGREATREEKGEFQIFLGNLWDTRGKSHETLFLFFLIDEAKWRREP